MRQVVLAGVGSVVVEDGALPSPGPGELRVRAEVVGICGSDLHALAGTHPFVPLPVVPGHEAAGVVDALGPGVTSFAVGDRVLLEPNVVCGTCARCVEGRYNLCASLSVIGCQSAGALAEAFVAPASRFHRMPAGMTMTDAAMVEPLSTATHAVRVAGGVAGRHVYVIGAGSIGQLTMLVARASGAASVAITDPVAAKRELAVSLGAVLEIGEPDVVFDCVAIEATMAQAVACVAKGGTVVVVGVPRGPVSVPLHLIQDRELRLQGTAMYVRSDVERAIALIASGEVPAGRLVSAEFGLQDAAEAFAAAGGERVKVHVRPQG